MCAVTGKSKMNQGHWPEGPRSCSEAPRVAASHTQAKAVTHSLLPACGSRGVGQQLRRARPEIQESPVLQRTLVNLEVKESKGSVWSGAHIPTLEQYR